MLQRVKFYSLGIKFFIILAPTGYPQIIPEIIAKDPLPEILKIRIIIGSKKKLIKSIISVLIKIFVPIKKGKSAGKILFAHKIIALRDEFKISFGNKNKNKLNKAITKIKIKFDTIFFIFTRYIFLSRLNFLFIKFIFCNIKKLLDEVCQIIFYLQTTYIYHKKYIFL